MKTKFKTPKKIRVAGDWIMKYFRYIVSGFAILYFGIVLNFCPISENLQLNKIMLSLFLSYILKTMLEKYLKEKINKIINIKKIDIRLAKKFIIVINILVWLIFLWVPMIIKPIFLFLGVSLFLGTGIFIAFSNTPNITNNNLVQLLKSSIFVSIFIFLGIIISLLLLVVPLIPDYQFSDFLLSYIFIVITEMFELTDVLYQKIKK